MENTQTLQTVPQHNQGLIRPIARPDELIQLHKEVSALIAQALEKGTDYGTIPGTDKPTLLKPGAERLCLAFGAHPEYEILEQTAEHDREVNYTKRKWNQAKRAYDEDQGKALGLYRFVVRCRLIRSTGERIGDAIGSCSTLESKYVSRPRDCENTVLKMAQKRALVGAVLNALGLSDRFTQDIDDVVDTVVVPAEEVYTGEDKQKLKLFNLMKEAGITDSADQKRIHENMRGKKFATAAAVIKEVNHA